MVVVLVIVVVIASSIPLLVVGRGFVAIASALLEEAVPLEEKILMEIFGDK